MKQFPSQRKEIKAKVNKQYHKRIKSFNAGEGFRRYMSPSEKAYLERFKEQGKK